MPKVGFFPGSTLGKFRTDEACVSLRSAPIFWVRRADGIGVDLKRRARVYQAYNDAAASPRALFTCSTAINRELGGNFDPRHSRIARSTNRERHRIEMHLSARRPERARAWPEFFHSAPARASTPKAALNTARTLPRWRALGLDAARMVDRCGAHVLVHAAVPRTDFFRLATLSRRDLSEIDSQAATMIMIAVVAIESINGDSSPANQARIPSATMPAPWKLKQPRMVWLEQDRLAETTMPRRSRSRPSSGRNGLPMRSTSSSATARE